MRVWIYSHFIQSAFSWQAETTNDNELSILEIRRYIYKEVNEYSNDRQHPDINISDDRLDDFVFAKY